MKKNIKTATKTATTQPAADSYVESLRTPGKDGLSAANRRRVALADAHIAAREILDSESKHRYHAAAALRYATTNMALCDNKDGIQLLVTAAVVAAEAVLSRAESRIALAAIKADAIPMEVLTMCVRKDGSSTAAPLLRFLAADSVAAERARIAGIKAADKAEKRRAEKAERKANKAAAKASATAK